MLPTSVKETEGRRGGEEEGNLGIKKGERKREGRGEKRRERDKEMMNIKKFKRGSDGETEIVIVIDVDEEASRKK